MSKTKLYLAFQKHSGLSLDTIQQDLSDIEENVEYHLAAPEIDLSTNTLEQLDQYTLTDKDAIIVENVSDFSTLEQYIEWLEEQVEKIL